MATMFVIGIDFGNDTSRIAVYRAGDHIKLENIVANNDFSVRATSTPSFVAFSHRNRIFGSLAKHQLMDNINWLRNTIFGFKRLLGKAFDDPDMEHESSFLPAQNIIRCEDGTIGVKVHYLDEDRVFSITQLTAMFFSKLKETAEAEFKCKINECVISVPFHFENAQREALLDAASIAGLKVLRLLNDTTAAALTYAIQEQDLPEINETPRNVVFVDWGHSSLQVSVCAVNRDKVKILASAADSQLGGRDIDVILAEPYSKKFQFADHPVRKFWAMSRLLPGVENLKKQLSTSNYLSELNVKVECIKDESLPMKINLNNFKVEELCRELFARVESTFLKCRLESKLKKKEIHLIEIVGGSSRIPAIKSLIKKVFGKWPSTTLNQDEAVAVGCALQGAMLCSPNPVRTFTIIDIQNYSINIFQNGGSGAEFPIEVFPQNHQIPSSKLRTVDKREGFVLKAVYAHNNRLVGKFSINEIESCAQNQRNKVRVKICIDENNILNISNAVLVREQEMNDAVELKVASAVSQAHASSSEEPPLKKSKIRWYEKIETIIETGLPIKCEVLGSYTTNELNNLIEEECKMTSIDHEECARIEGRNALEKYVYKLRIELSSPEELASFILEKEREKLIDQLYEIDEWLMNEGDNCELHVYLDKLKAMQDKGEPIKIRKLEYKMQPKLLEEFSSILQLTRKVVDQYKADDERYSGIESIDVETIRESTEFALQWVEETRENLSFTPRCENPSVSSDQIKTKKDNFEETVIKVLSQPKPLSLAALLRDPSKELSKCVNKENDELDTLVNTISSVLPSGTSVSFVRALCNIISPKFENINHEMFNKFLIQLQTKIDKFMVRLDDTIKTMAPEIFNPLKSALEEQKELFEKSLLNTSGSSTSPLFGVINRNPEENIDLLIEQGKVDVAIDQVLSASDLKLLVNLCEKLDAETIFAKPITEQHILLSFIQQLSVDLNDQTELKHKFIEGAAMCLDKKHPFCEEYFPKILPVVRSRVTNYVEMNPTNKNTRSMKILGMIIDSLLDKKSH